MFVWNPRLYNKRITVKRMTPCICMFTLNVYYVGALTVGLTSSFSPPAHLFVVTCMTEIIKRWLKYCWLWRKTTNSPHLIVLVYAICIYYNCFTFLIHYVIKYAHNMFKIGIWSGLVNVSIQWVINLYTKF